jgi:putative methyltransferase (TIGR04325 family)
MPSFIRIKKLAHLLLPPLAIRWLARTKPIPQQVPLRVAQPKPFLEYAPDGWKTREASSEIKGWNVESVIQIEESKWQVFCNNCLGTGPLGFSHEHTDLTQVRNVSFHNVHMTYAYVLALVTHLKADLSILDWGGALGHYYQLGRSLVPDVAIDYHCKEVPAMVDAGKRLNPEVHWYTDETCLNRTYDLVMNNSSLQYMRDWPETLRRLARAANEYLFLGRMPIADKGPTFFAIQRVYETEMIHQQFNQEEFLAIVEAEGFRVVREFVGERFSIDNAPEQCELRSWLFKREHR